MLILISSIASYSQFIHKIKADSVLITNDSCNAELNLENSTRNIKGFLYNRGNGRTEFRKAVKLNDSTLIFGEDTLVIRGAMTASNGLSMTGNDVRLGQVIGAAGNPAQLTGTRDIPTNGNNLLISGTGNTYVGNRTVEGNNTNFFATSTLRSYTEYTTSSNPTKNANFGAFQYLFLNDGASLNSIYNLYSSQVFRLKGAAAFGVGNPAISAHSFHTLFSKASDSQAPLVVTGQSSPLNVITAFETRMGATNAGAITLNGWYSGLTTTFQLNSAAHSMENYTDINLGVSVTNAGATLGTRYGLYINALKQSFVSGSAYGIYQAGASDRNFFGGLVGIGATVPTALLHIKAGSASAGTAPLKFTSGSNLTTPENGAVEYDGTNYFVTSANTRYTLAKTLTTTAALDFTSTAAQSASDLTVTITGAADGDAVSLGIPNAAVNGNSSYSAWVSAANTVTVRFNNYSSGAIDPANGTFRISIIKY